MHLPLYKVEDTPLQTQEDDILTSCWPVINVYIFLCFLGTNIIAFFDTPFLKIIEGWL